MIEDLAPKIIEGIASEAIKQSIANITTTWLKPCLENIKKKHKLRKNIDDNVFCSKFENYLEIVSNEYKFMNTIVFNNQQKKIEDLYIPLTLKNEKNFKETLMNEYQTDLFEKYQYLLIKDSAGMGKSTLMKYIFISCIKKNVGIPIFIELRRLNKKNTILDEMFNNLNPLNEEFDKDFIFELIVNGSFIFFIDGYDEISFNSTSDVTRDIRQFIKKANKNIFILSSRPQEALSAFGNFQSFTIKPLNKSEAYKLLRKYDENGRYSENLISKLDENDTYKQIDEFLSNPLMVSLLYKGFEYIPTVPYKKHLFYRNVYDALFEHHDISKGDSFIREKNSNLDSEEFHRVLRKLAYLSLLENNIEFDKDKLLDLIDKSKHDLSETKINSNDFLKDLHISVPLFVELGNKYKWAHKSFMEYFSAKYIEMDANKIQEEILEAIYNSKRDYTNLLDLYYDIDYPTFEKVFLYRICKDFLKHTSTTYNDNYYKGFSENEVVLRKSLTFNKVLIILHKKTDDAIKHISSGNNLSYIYDSEKNLVGVNRINSTTESILELLIIKKNDLINDSPYEEYKFDLDDSIIFEDKIILDDSPGNILNSTENFGRVNNLLIQALDWTLDFTQVNMFITRIENKQINNKNDYIDGL